MKVVLIIGIILMLAIVGCNGTNTQPQYQPSPNQAVGGGCGVAPAEDSKNIEQLPKGSDL